MTIGQVGGPGPSPTPNTVTQLHTGAAGATNGQMVSDKNMSERNLALFNAASNWSKPEGTQTALEDLPKVKIAQESALIDEWDEAIDTNPGEVPLQTLTGILRKLFDGAFANKCKKLLLVSDKGQILMTRRGLGAEMYAHIEGEKNYKKEKHLSIDDNLTLSVLRALYRDNTVQKFLPLNGAVGRGPAAADMPDDKDAPDNMGSRPGSRRGSGLGHESGSESEFELDSGAIFSGVLCHRFTSPDAILCHRMANEPGVDINEDNIQNGASGFDKDIFDRDAGLTEERNQLHSSSEGLEGSAGSESVHSWIYTRPFVHPETSSGTRSAEQTIPEQIVQPAANELKVDSSPSIKPIGGADSIQEDSIYMEVKIAPEGIATQAEIMGGNVDSRVTPLPSPSSSTSVDTLVDASTDNGARIAENLKKFEARERIDYSIKRGVPRAREVLSEVTRL